MCFLRVITGPNPIELATQWSLKYTACKRVFKQFHSLFGFDEKHFRMSFQNADFFMWYNLDKSFPAPATYFDINTFLPDLISPPVVTFEQKITDASVVWICSNCNAFNGREIFVKKLMNYLKVDSFGRCMMNKDIIDQTGSRCQRFNTNRSWQR